MSRTAQMSTDDQAEALALYKKKHDELVICEFCAVSTDWGGDGCTLRMSRKEPKGAELDPEQW